MDIFEVKERSRIMSRVKGGDSKMELKFRKALWRNGFRYIKNAKKYYGKPDLVLPKYKTVIFLDSCFWHKCPLHYKAPETNIDFWETKIGKNWGRDRNVDEHYKILKWRLIRVWEHELSKRDLFSSTIDAVVKKLADLPRGTTFLAPARTLKKVIGIRSTLCIPLKLSGFIGNPNGKCESKHPNY